MFAVRYVYGASPSSNRVASADDVAPLGIDDVAPLEVHEVAPLEVHEVAPNGNPQEEVVVSFAFDLTEDERNEDTEGDGNEGR